MDLRKTVSLLLLLLLGLCDAHDGNDHDAHNEISVDNSDTEDFTTTILRMNNGSRDFLEGDIMMPKTRNAMKCYRGGDSCLWAKSSNGNVEVPYTISYKYDNQERNEILSAMKYFEYSTCIRFVPRARQRAYLCIQPRFGCSSLLGTTGGKQVLSLQRFGCVRRGIIQHELLHALGFFHEHTRSDRDEHVKINWDNIIGSFGNNFRKQNTNNLHTPYDYSSVMHYGRTAFGKQQSETITPVPDSSVSIGQRENMSKIDILRINRLYKCRGFF